MKTDTIAAIATAMTNSGIGVVRISGDEAVEVAERIFRFPNKNKKLSECESHTVHYGFVTDGEETIDEVMVLLLRAPRTYTREDTVEIDCHGGVLVMRRILDLVLQNGARAAEAGEFTKRAFLNGRIDLAQAESVIDVINAGNEFALKASMEQLNGAVSEEIKKLRAVILHEIAFIESALDDPEHYQTDGYGETLLQKLSPVAEELNRLILHAEDGAVLKEGIHTVIVGKPNSGKSSLLNTLAGKERAIVTDIAGTTRDVIEEQIMLNGICLNVIDTAGIRTTEDIVERIGVDKAKESVEKADLIIYMVDSSKPLDKDDEDIIELIKDKKVIVLLNKSDLAAVTSEEDMKKRLDKNILSVSAKLNTGIEELEHMIEEMFLHGEIGMNEEIYITNARHKASLKEASESLKLVENSVLAGMPEDFYSVDLMNAYEALGSIIGEAVEDDLVNEIFSKFCMGK